LARAKEIRGELLMIFGTKDPHVPDAGRETIDRALRSSGARCNTLLYPAEHAFTRDEGPRFDPEATDLAFAEMIRLFRKVFQS
jgi:carboxymethylenebutenolidase